MRAAFALILLLALVPGATAGEPAPCEPERTAFEPAPGARLGVELTQRECTEGRSLMLAIREPGGRETVEWYDDERGRGVETVRPPYFASWTESDRGCAMTVYVFAFGATEVPCAAGSPPPPPVLP